MKAVGALLICSIVFACVLTTEAGYPPIRERSAWGARPARRTTTMSVFGIVIHHTASPNASDFRSSGSATTIKGMQNYHMDNNGWRDIGYHFIVDPDGVLWRGVASPTHVGTHVGGFNTGRVGIVVGGDYQSRDQLSTAAYNTLVQTVAAVAEAYGVSLTTYPRGHRQFKSTSCPGDRIYSRLAQIRLDASKGGPGGGPGPGPTPTCTSGLPEASHGSCTDGTNPGRCMPTSTCTGAGHVHKSGLCPGPTDIRCCFNSKCGCNEVLTERDPQYNANCRFNSQNGVCINTSKTNCPGTVRRGLCPGPSNIRCCFARSCVLSAGAQAAAGLGIMGATAAGVGGFYYTSRRRRGLAKTDKEESPSPSSPETPASLSAPSE